MDYNYTAERNVQLVVAFLKEHNVRQIVVSPGTTNITFVASVQNDSFFKLWSAADERSAAYIACGLASETGEPVALSCTGATASRNYVPGLTEAYYRHLPIIAITACHRSSEVGNNIAQVLDRTQIQHDIAKTSVLIPIIFDTNDVWKCTTRLNRAFTELKRRGGGPIHINLESTFCKDYSVKELPKVKLISHYTLNDKFPNLPSGKIAIYVSAHNKWTDEEIRAIDNFCKSNNAVVLYDKTSNYTGECGVLSALLFSQENKHFGFDRIDLLIHIGTITGDYYSANINTKEVWRVAEDGEIRDTFRKMTCIFEMQEKSFFAAYSNESHNTNNVSMLRKEYTRLYNNIPDIPFSNIWIAKILAPVLPTNSTLHLGILNSLRSWNFFETDKSIKTSSNVGGFGIDGGVSSLVGASLADENRLYFGVFGDLAFFYDMNVLGNHNIKNNLRIMLVNNGRGTEFRNYSHDASRFGEDADLFMAAAGHYGNKSKDLVRHYASDLGFIYLSASSKEEFEETYNTFISNEKSNKPILFEVFTDSNDESEALWRINHIDEPTLKDNIKKIIKPLKGIVKDTIGDEHFEQLKCIIQR